MNHSKNRSTPRMRAMPTRKQQRLLACIQQLHCNYQRDCDTQDLFASLLDALLVLTDSPYGAGGEVLPDAAGRPEFRIRAVTYPPDAAIDTLAPLFKKTLDRNRALIVKPTRTNHGFPNGFLGLPLYSGKTLIGAVGVANRSQGYTQTITEFVQPLLLSFSSLLQAHRNDQRLRHLTQELQREISGRDRIEDTLDKIATAVSVNTGAEYFRSLARQLSAALHVDAALISIPSAVPGNADVLAFYDRGEMQDTERYELSGTPCEKILKAQNQYYPAGLQEKFPHGAFTKAYGWDSYIGVPLYDVSGSVLGLVAVADRKPIPRRQPAEAILRICAARIAAELVHQRAKEKMFMLSRALEQTADSVAITNRDGIIEYINPAFIEMTGFGADEALGRKPNILKSGRHDMQFYRQLWATLRKGQVYRDVFINRKKSGELYYEEKTITPLKDLREQITHYISTGKDVTERMQTQERLHYLAYHDVLTELPNRALFLEWLNRALTSNGGGRKLAVISLDIDRFKIINDTLGHNIGDRVLLALAHLLKRRLKKEDTLARLSGDEFAVLVEHINGPTEVIGRIRNILEAMAQPLQIKGNELYVTASIGIALAPEDGTDANTLLKNADAALNRAKEQGRHTYQFYSTDLSDKAYKQLSLETSLYRALERQEFHLRYQPQVDLEVGRTVGLEALLRWQHPELGLIDPLEFIPLLEDTGLIIPVGEWVLRDACHEAARWQKLNASPLRLSVNLSGRQFNDPNLFKAVEGILTESALSSQQLELEITESVLMQNDQASTDNLSALQALGVRIAIDDFGTGYSSLSYLKRFPVDTLKIDRSFIHDVSHNPDDETIIKAIIAMAHSLQVDTVAEGVETHDQLHFLRGCGCHSAQGFLLSKPFLPADLPRFLQQPVPFA